MDDSSSKRYSGFSVLGGIIFAAGWWVLIDGYGWGSSSSGCVGPRDSVTETQGYAWIPLLGATIVFLMINGMKWSELREDGMNDPRTAAKARIFLIAALFIACGSIAGSGFLMADKFLSRGDPCAWSGISCFLGTLLVLLASFVMRFGTLPPSDGY